MILQRQDASSPLITVIVPVYKVAPYIEKCARSIFEQTFKSLEIFFINDCTPDNSVEIIERVLNDYPQRQSLTRIISLPRNSGQAEVRRRGIIEATGEYIIHCDGDDWVDLDLYEKLYQKAILCNADIVVCDEVYELASCQELHRTPLLPEDCRAVVRNWYRSSIGMFFHNKLVRRALYVDYSILPWPGLNMWEDNGVMMRIFYYGRNLAQIHDSYYHYNRTNQNAITADYGKDQVIQMITVAQYLTDFFEVLSDAKNYAKTVQAVQFLAKINLISDDFQGLKQFYSIFPGAEAIISELDLHAFSHKGLCRFYMVLWHFAWLFILMFKIYRFFCGKFKRRIIL